MSRDPLSELLRPSTRDKLLRFIASSEEPSPYLLVDREIVREKTETIGKGVEGAKVFYAVKANPDVAVLRLINDAGLDFEVASEGELSILESLGVDGSRMISSNPVKSVRFLREAVARGVDRFAFDSGAEVDKLSLHAPGSRVYVRLSVPNEGSEWPLSRKFGVEIEDALRLLLYAREKGLEPVGLTFHVGSQCLNVYNWEMALDKAKQLWDGAARHGMSLRILNIGGGYPVRYTRNVMSIAEIESRIDRAIRSRFGGELEVHIEPGRAVVGDAGIFVASVIGKARRGEEHWLYLDVGVFNGLMESVGGIRYRFITEGRGSVRRWTIAGPSCDSFDVIDRDVELPEPHVGDTVLILSSGAYTVSYASEFNGFPIPKTILI